MVASRPVEGSAAVFRDFSTEPGRSVRALLRHFAGSDSGLGTLFRQHRSLNRTPNPLAPNAPFRFTMKQIPHPARMAKLADAADLKSAGRKAVGVQVPLRAPATPSSTSQSSVARPHARTASIASFGPPEARKSQIPALRTGPPSSTCNCFQLNAKLASWYPVVSTTNS